MNPTAVPQDPPTYCTSTFFFVSFPSCILFLFFAFNIFSGKKKRNKMALFVIGRELHFAWCLPSLQLLLRHLFGEIESLGDFMSVAGPELETNPTMF